MNRRGFLKSILAAGVAPYVSTMAGVLMPAPRRVFAEGGIVEVPPLVIGEFPAQTIYYGGAPGGGKSHAQIESRMSELWGQYTLKPTEVWINDERLRRYSSYLAQNEESLILKHLKGNPT